MVKQQRQIAQKKKQQKKQREEKQPAEIIWYKKKIRKQKLNGIPAISNFDVSKCVYMSLQTDKNLLKRLVFFIFYKTRKNKHPHTATYNFICCRFWFLGFTCCCCMLSELLHSRCAFIVVAVCIAVTVNHHNLWCLLHSFRFSMLSLCRRIWIFTSVLKIVFAHSMEPIIEINKQSKWVNE